MTEQELYNEVYSDRTNALHFSDAKDQKFRRMVLKAHLFPVRAHTHYLSPKKNNWIILLEARSKKEIGDLSRITFVAIYNSPHGYYAVMPSSTSEVNHLILYPPHFFSRFAERTGIELTGMELIRRYFTCNNSYAFDISKIRDSEIFGSSEEGVALGVISKNRNIFFKTYISYDMLKGAQVDTFAETEKIRREMHEKNT